MASEVAAHAYPRPLESGLTPTQQMVLRLMAEGYHDEAIASRAGISTTSVRRHVNAIMDKLGVNSRFVVGAAASPRPGQVMALTRIS